MARAWWLGGLVVSGAVHIALAAAMARIPKNGGHQSTTVTMASSKKAKKDESKKDVDKPPEPPKPIKVPPRALARAAPAEPPPPAQNTPPPPVNSPAANAALAAMPDFGISLAGGDGPGIGVPMGGSGSNVAAAPAKTAAPVAHSVQAQKPAEDEPCSEALSKPKVLTQIQAQYVDTARAAGVEGRVRISVTIDATGNVISARVLSGLGSGLDESSMSAAKRMKFSPGTRCGKAVESTAVVTMRFALGD